MGFAPVRSLPGMLCPEVQPGSHEAEPGGCHQGSENTRTSEQVWRVVLSEGSYCKRAAYQHETRDFTLHRNNSSFTGLTLSIDYAIRGIKTTKIQVRRCTSVVQLFYPKGMKGRAKSRPQQGSSIRQSVTIPAHLATAVRRVAKEKHLTMSRALVILAERGLEAETAARENLNASYRRFMTETDLHKKNEAGKDLIRAIFGADAIAEDPVL